MAAAKHIEVAKRDGAKAGFKMWRMNLKRSGIPQVQERYQELLAQGDVEAQFRYYCAQYGSQFGLAPKSQGRTSKPATQAAQPATTNDLFAAFQAFLEQQGTASVTDEAESDDLDEVDAALDAIEEPTQATATTRHNATAADPYAPREPNAHATNGRLWKLNELGLLTIRKTPGDAISNGDAHAVLKSLL